jgi:hypothetical protein
MGNCKTMRVTARISCRLVFVRVLFVFLVACSSSPPCAPSAPPDGGCGQSFNVDYDPASQNGCVFNSGSGTTETCASLCGGPASCELLTFTSVQCTTAKCQ